MGPMDSDHNKHLIISAITLSSLNCIIQIKLNWIIVMKTLVAEILIVNSIKTNLQYKLKYVGLTSLPNCKWHFVQNVTLAAKTKACIRKKK